MDENTDRTPIINVINESSSFDADDDESTGYDGYVTPDELITNYSQPNLLSRSSFQRQSQTSSSSKLSDHPPFDSARMQYGSEQDFRTRLQNYFLENQKSSLRIRSFHFFIKVLSCVLYCVRVVNDNGRIPESVNKPHYGPEDVKYAYLIWVDRSFYLWACQVIVAVISMIENVVIFYLSYKGSAFRVLLNINFLLELLTSAPLVVTIFKPEWRELYVPIFLNCWLAMNALQEILSDLNRVSQVGQSALFRQMIVLFSVLICLIFTGACGMEHLQRAGQRHFDLFTSLYFVMVTFSTVGYGDLYPDTWMSRLYVISLICIAFGILPSQIEALGEVWHERQKAGCHYTKSKSEKHVVVTVTHLEAEFIQDFLTEFYAHTEHQEYLVILLSPCEMDDKMRMLLRIPMWMSRVIYIRGSSLKDSDLERASMASAKACFILSARYINEKDRTDEHTILRSWAIKDFAPHVPQYVQIFRPETKMHIEHAEVMVCEDEFKYSLLANNCICPGISSFITLLMHTSRGEEGQKSKEPWHKVYGFHSGNEIYDIVVGESKFFGEFVGRSFTFASFTAHKVYGVNLIGVKSAGLNEPIRLNPGHTYFLKATDTAYYIALTNEESLTNFRKSLTRQQRKANIASTIANIGTVALEVPSAKKTSFKSRTMKIKNRLLKHKDNDEEQVNLIGVPADFGLRKSSVGVVVDAEIENPDSETESICTECEGVCIADKLRKTVPPLTSYVGASFTVCHILKEKRPICCLELCSPCEHCAHQTADEYKWTRPAIIVAADQTCSGLYNLIIPLRAYYRPVHSLQPIILLLELQDDGTPRKAFLDVIAWFPMVYWMEGKISSLDNLLKAGVCLADNVVVVKEGTTDVEEHLADCTTIITVQKIHRMFPRLRMITELTHQTNMRFMQFDADDDYALEQSKFEKKERKRGSTMSFMFRLPFAAGGVFSANMLDRLLYQAFVKEYVVDFLRLLLGIDQSEGSGYLTSFTITKEDIWIRTYGRLYQKLCSSVADIPIGVYRTKEISSRKSSRRISLDINISPKVQISIQRRKNETKREISALVQYRMQNLGMSVDNYDCNDRKGTVSYVIINPSFDLELEAGDIVYVLRPPVPQETANTNIVNPRRGLKRVTSEPQLSPDTHILTSANVTEVNVNDEDGASDDQSKGEKEKH